MSSPTTKNRWEAASTEALDLAAEVRQGIADIEAGNCVELTPDQLKEWAETGELRALDEWLGESLD